MKPQLLASDPLDPNASAEVEHRSQCATRRGPEMERVLDQALARVARLEAALAASGGALHDVNNLLTVLSGQLFLMTEALREQPEILDKSRSARNAAERASALIRELLGSAQDACAETNIVCPAHHVVAATNLLRRGIPSMHRFAVAHDDDPWTVRASASQLESALANLVINAAEAMSEPGMIDVRIDKVSVDAGLATQRSLEAGDYVRISVADNGPGIPADRLQDIRQPLVTTKARGHGYGIGLSMVDRFARAAGGSLHIDSREGHGTRMSIYLPRSAERADVTANLTLPLATLPNGDETVMLCTRDNDVRQTVGQLLSALGYTVLTAKNRAEALAHASRTDSIAVIVSDRFGITRDEYDHSLRSLRHSQPEMRQVVILELGEDIAEVAANADASVHRPVAIAELAIAVRKAIGVSVCR